MRFVHFSLMVSAAACVVASVAPAQEQGGQPAAGIILQRAADAKFMTVPGLDPCTTLAPLRGNMATGASTLMVRMTPGCAVPYHWHTPSEEIVVLQGAPLAQMMGERSTMLSVGAYSQLPSHHVHRFRCASRVPCLLFLVADAKFDVHYVDEHGKEIPADAALRAAKKGW